jgi:hypothetical protein
MKNDSSIGNELLVVLSEWYNEAIKKYQLIFSSYGSIA